MRQLIVLAGFLWTAPAVAWDPPGGQDAHAHHHVVSGDGLARSEYGFMVPAVVLVRDDGRSVRFDRELDPDRTVVLSFIYTACTTICPLTSATLAQFEGRLGSARGAVQIASVSIDPEEDKPARLRAYARKFGAGPNWRHYTGSVEAIIEVQRAFDAYRGDKMNHAPDTYIRRAGSKTWVRLAGFASVNDLLIESGSAAPPP